MRTGSSLRGDSIALDVDGANNANRLSTDSYKRQFSLSSAPEEARKRSNRSWRHTAMSISSGKDEKDRYRTGRKRKIGYAKAQMWCPAWGSFSIKDTIGVLLALAGIMLLLLILVGATSNSISGIYYARVYNRDGSPGEARFGLRGYCIATATSSTLCIPSTDFVYIPWGKAHSDSLA